MTRDKDTNRRFHTRYSLPVTDAALAVEREVIGANVGASGYTTVAQADALIPELPLRPGTRLPPAGPAGVPSRRREHVDLLRSAGFAAVREIDVTAAFLRATRAWHEARARYAGQLSQAEGEGSFRERRRDYHLQARAIEAGLLRRSLFVAERAA